MHMTAYILHGITVAQHIRIIEQLLIRKPALHIVLHFINHKLNSRFLKDPGLPKAALDAAWIFLLSIDSKVGTRPRKKCIG